jgi:HJR/Mrr/RecB family endonuclease
MAVQGFTYKLSWGTDFNDVDSQPAGFTDRSARTKASVTLDPKMMAKRDSKESEYYFNPSTVIVSIKAVKAESWVLKEMKSDKLLKHEQMHYNISALGGRDLERKILALRDMSGQELMNKKAALGTEMQNLIDQVNKDYDADLLGTKHGTKDAEQSKWELHITNLMNKPDAELKSL